MSKRIMALITALIMFITPIWFPASAVHASGPETDAVIENNTGEPCSDNDISDDSLDERKDDSVSEFASESETETEPKTEEETEIVMETEDFMENESESGKQGESGDIEESGTGPEENIPEADTELETEPPESPTSELFNIGGGLGGGWGDYEIFRFNWENQYDTYYLETGGDPADLPLAATAYGYLNWVDYVECAIAWHYEDIDPNLPGRYLITGDILLPDDYNASCDTTAYYAVIVYDPDGPPSVMAVKVGSYMRNNIIVPLGTSGEELEIIFINKAWLGLPPLSIWIETEDGYTCDGVLTGWDASLVNTSRVGVYYPFFIEPPPGVGLPESKGPGAEVAGAEIIVLDPDTVSLRAYNYDSDTGSLYVHWLKEISEPELWLSIDSGEWEPASEYHYFWSDGLRLELGNNNSVYQSGHVYEFQVRYENGGVSEDTLVVDFTSGKPVFSAPGGDRTGGDRDENDLPPVNPDDGTPADPDNGKTTPTPDNHGSGENTPTPVDPGGETPAPTPANPDSETPAIPIPSAPPAAWGTTDEQSNSGGTDTEPVAAIMPAPTAVEPLAKAQDAPVTAKPAEYSDERGVTVSGERLAMMIAANPLYVTFFRGELRASLPALFLESLALSPGDTFTVTLYQPDESSFVVYFAVNGNQLTYRFDEPFIVSIPWSGGPVSCAPNAGEATVDSIKDFIKASLDGGRAEFALHYTGIYDLTEQEREIPVMSYVQYSDIPPINASAPEPGTLTSLKTQPSLYTDGWARVVMAGMIGIAGAGVFFYFARKRSAKRP